MPAEVRRKSLRGLLTPPEPWRSLLGALLTVATLLGLTAALAALRAPAEIQTSGFLYLAVVVLGSLLFGGATALVGSLTSALLMDYFFLPPVGRLTIYSAPALAAWAAFLLVSLGVGLLATSRRRSLEELRTARDRLEAANTGLRRAGAELEASLSARTDLARTEAALEATRRAEAFRQELLATVSHELRTPLAALLGHGTALMEDQGLRRLQHPGHAQAIVAEARRLDRLIRDLLELARIETGQLDVEIEVIDLCDAIREAARRWRGQLSPSLRLDGAPVLVLADWDRVQQLLDNALSNVSRHSGTREVTIEVLSPSPARQTAAECHIQDRGVGIPAQLQEHLFERYARDRRGGGLGVGLSVCRWLAEAMGGAVWVESKGKGAGTAFHFLLPLEAGKCPAALTRKAAVV
jgi:K+-sensing histidine kinase KdpD